jgi:NAD(P)-dependent dehydrogenase (short-subunit alcohol dehydrogenase family)
VSRLDGKVAIVTGAGRGIGREHALALARAGAKVLVNDLGGSLAGEGTDASPAEQVVEEIRELGGEAAANADDVSDFAGAKRMVDQAVGELGGLDILVNNAGILRDRMLANMEEHEWDAVIAVHLKGHFAPTHHAAALWRDRSKAGEQVRARVINTSSPSGVFGNVGQSNYGAAKAGIASLTVIAAQELGRYGVTVNAISPTALTRMTEDLPQLQDPDTAAALDPSEVSPLVAWLASHESNSITGRVFAVRGRRISVLEGWSAGPSRTSPRRWRADELGPLVDELLTSAAPNADMSGRRS